MSYVTNVMVSHSILERVDDVMGLPMGDHYEQSLRKISEGAPAEAWGGSKFPEVDVWAAAFNYITVEQVLAHVASIAWVEPENVQVFIQDQEDDRFLVYVFREGQLVKVL